MGQGLLEMLLDAGRHKTRLETEVLWVGPRMTRARYGKDFCVGGVFCEGPHLHPS